MAEPDLLSIARRLANRAGRRALILAFLLGAAVLRLDQRAGRLSGTDGDVAPAREVGDAAGNLPIPVTADTVRRGTLVLQVAATGQAEASRRLVLVAETAGRILALPIGENARVVRGQVLVRLDPGLHALRVQRAEADLEQARAQYRELTLFDERIEDEEIRREREAGVRARTGLARAEIALREARMELASTSPTAPFAGRVAELRVTAGEAVEAGQELVTMVDLDPIHIDVRVVESELSGLRPGNGAEVRLTALPDTVLHGRIASISPIVDPRSRTVRVRVVLSNPEGAILPGMFAEVALDGRSFADRVLVPEEAIVERDGRRLVFLFEPVGENRRREGRARWTYVTPGLANGRFVELVEGEATEIPPIGSLVITGGGRTLVHDALVTIAVQEGDR